ncbi:hypothetical protein [Staphylococcus phage vB_StaM_PB50]|nr:hypothetical protein [Staphylococcus phage vB_StaM_PB50]
MVRKADNNELDNFMSEDELKELGVDVDKKQEETNNNQNKSQNNRNKNNNRNSNKNKRKKNNNQNKSAIPTQRNKNNQKQNEEAKTDHIDLSQPEPAQGYKDYDHLTQKNEEPTLSSPAEDTESMTLDQFESHQQDLNRHQQKVQKEIEELSKIDSNERNNILSNINVDLNNIEIISDIDYDVNKENTNFVLNSKATHQVVLSQSAYIAHMESLRNQEILSIAESIDDDYNSVLKRYQLYFHKVNTNSLGIKNFSDFAKLTSVYDVSTLEYGLYNISFPGETKFDIKCGSCKEELKDVKISNDQLMSFKDEKAYEHVTKNVHNITTKEENEKHSLISKTERIMLNDSKIIFDIITPTIDKHLTVLASIHTDGLSPEEADRFKNNSTALMHVKNVYVPDLKSLKEDGKPKFQKIPEESLQEIMTIIENLSVRDGHQLTDKIYDSVGKNAIEYAINGAKCPNCGNDLGKIDIDMTEVLFKEALHLV